MEPLTRITYREPATGQPRSQTTIRRESLVDYENYLRPWERAHGSALHSPGVGAGLEVRATQGTAGLQVRPGLALNADGDHIVLAAGGWASFNGGRVPVTDAGVPVVTTGLDGQFVLTISWAELPDERVFDSEQRKVADQTPQLNLRPAAASVDRTDVVLAAVTITAGTVAGLGVGDRRQCGGQLALTRPVPIASGSALSVGSEVAAQLRPVGGGLEVAVPGSLSIAADGLAVRGPAGATALALDAATGNLGIGTATPQARLDVAGPIAVGGQEALSSGDGFLNLNPSGGFGRGVHTPGVSSAGSANIGGGGNWADPGAGNLAVGGRAWVGKKASTDVQASLVVDTDNSTLDTAAFRKTALGPSWSHVHYGPTGDWYVRSAATTGKVVLQDAGGSVGIGTANPHARLEVQGDVLVTGPLSLTGALTVTGGPLAVDKITPTAALEVTKGLKVTSGSLDAQQGLRVTGPLTVTGALALNGAFSITGGALAVDKITPSAALEVSNGLKVAGPLTVTGALSVTGAALAVNSITSTGQLQVSKGLAVTGGSLDAAQGMRVTGDSSVTGTLSVDRLSSRFGSVAAAGGLSTDGWISAQQSLSVGTNASIGGTLSAFNVDSQTITANGSIRASDGTLGVVGNCTDDSTAAIGVYGGGIGARSTGVKGEANVGADAYGVWGVSSEGYAGFFTGKVRVTGMLEKPGGGFRIDHPLDPENKFLSHSFVESPDMLNLYCGVVETDNTGEADIELPDYFAALNQDFTYQLTVLGQVASATVIDEIADNRFTVKSAGPGMRVCWLVTGVRKDQFAMENRIVVEEGKPRHEKGKTPA
ncbi:MAG TPA: hypothetical protein VGM60_02870 [Pseudonocardia sp.]|uniref:hypothetical protein n=1 Tax=Pseudonocardia sp. TaxID=60912 RepID=UPI002F4269BF